MSIKYLYYWYKNKGDNYPSVLRWPLFHLFLLPKTDFDRWIQRIYMYGNNPEQLKYHVPQWFLDLYPKFRVI